MLLTIGAANIGHIKLLSGLREDPMVLPEVQSPVTQSTCCHHWIIETADGPVSLGFCQFCFETKEFKNSLEDWSFFKETIRVRNEFGVVVPAAEE